MNPGSDLAQLLALRSLREERAKVAVAIAGDRLHAAMRNLSEAEAAIDAHDLETDQRERRFFEAMHMRPFSENEFGRTQEWLHASDLRRDALIDKRNEAAAVAGECERQLASSREEWHRRLTARDKLAEAQNQLRRSELAKAEAAFEQEAEEMNADQARVPC